MDSDDDDQDENQDGENDQSGAEGAPDSDAAQEMSADQAQASTDEMSESAMESAQASTSDTFEDGELGDDETPGEATRPNSHGRNEPRGPEYHAFAPKFDEVIAAEDLCDHVRHIALVAAIGSAQAFPALRGGEIGLVHMK